jgi:hypothetical protein
MTNYNELSQNPPRFLSFTCYTVDEFQELLPYFSLKFQQYMKNFTFEGKKRRKRQYVEYKNCSLPTIENKLLFILTYLKGNDLQEKLAEMFGMQQSKANVWIHLLHQVLNSTLEHINMLPVRNAETLQKRLETSIDSVKSSVEKPDASINSVKSSVEEPDASIDSVKSLVEKPDASINSVKSSVEEPDASIDSVKSLVEEPDASIDSVKSLVEEPDASIDSVKSSAEKPDASIDSVKSLVEEPDASIDSVKSLVEKPDASIDSVKSLVEELDASIDSVKSLVEEPDASIDSVKSLVEKPDASINSVKSSAEKPDASIDSVKSLVEEPDASIDSVKSLVEEPDASIDSVKSSVEETDVSIDSIVEKKNVSVKVEVYFHDGTERPINRPLNFEIQKIYYSGKQKQHTVKNNMVINESCHIIFLSDTCFGSKHDKKLADEAGYKLPEGSSLYQDTGFQGFEIPEVNIIQPKKKPRGGELTLSEKEENRAISSIRVRVEHAIGGVKRYRIVKDKVRNWRKGFKDKVLETCCGLHNFRLKFRPWCYETAPI